MIIGSNATVMPVKTGDNCIIGTGAVVLKDVPVNSVITGNPARYTRKEMHKYSISLITLAYNEELNISITLKHKLKEIEGEFNKLNRNYQGLLISRTCKFGKVLLWPIRKITRS